jgi:hypothetical protein
MANNMTIGQLRELLEVFKDENETDVVSLVVTPNGIKFEVDEADVISDGVWSYYHDHK